MSDKKILAVVKNDRHFEITHESGIEGRLFILNDHVFRYQLDPTKKYLDYPMPHDQDHVANIAIKKLDEYDAGAFQRCILSEDDNNFTLKTLFISIKFNRWNGSMSVFNKDLREVIKGDRLFFCNGMSVQILHQNENEYFYGCGTQNGRFCHKGSIVYIVNSNNWIDGGVASPCPFYWSTGGYGILRNTWNLGKYDFSYRDCKMIKTEHKDDNFDAFYFINDSFVGIIRDYYELTGKPILMPEYGFYESHFNAYNRDYWVELSDTESKTKAVLFEDGKYYREFQPKDIGNRKGILESLNGENNNYQFSARAVIDRYKMYDMPLGWFIPNDGYGAGYGQTKTFDEDIMNLKAFVDYAESNGIRVGLWTESNLHPRDPSSPVKGDRDIAKEVGVAGIVALKTDEAWVGAGYSFGLNGVQDASDIFVRKTGGKIRPMIITVDGWAGTQRHSGIWSGDQTGGKWENIRFHIPTLIGTSLSGQPNIGSDIDGIFGGENKSVNIREYQWKSFTPIQTNMDGWGSHPKTPFQFDREATDINRAYLKLKSSLMPYIYSIGYEASNGLPMIRAMFLEFPNEESAYSRDSQYQYMWGPYFLVAPIYNDEQDDNNTCIRHGIYLPDPDQIWIDFFTGEKYRGGCIINNIEVPLWKLPVFVKDGAIIPMTYPNNNPNEIIRDIRILNIYPNGNTTFELFEDDGISTSYLKGCFVKTRIISDGPKSNEKGDLTITVGKALGSYEGFVTDKNTIFNIMMSEPPESVKVLIANKNLKLQIVNSEKEFNNGGDNIYFFNDKFTISPYFTEIKQTFLTVKLEKTNTSLNVIKILINGFINKGEIYCNRMNVIKDLEIPKMVTVPSNKITATSLTLQWLKAENAESYDVVRDSITFKNIKNSSVIFENFLYSTNHQFKVRTVNSQGVSEWSQIVVGKTSEDPYKGSIEGVKTTCNIPEQNGEELVNFTINDDRIWHTHWVTGTADPHKNVFIILKFDLGDRYSLSKIEYLPRSDAGNGTFLQVSYRTSSDDKVWTEYSHVIQWTYDNSSKVINLEKDDVRFVEIKVLNSVGNFGSGRKILFFKK